MNDAERASVEDRIRTAIGSSRVVAALFSSYTFGRQFFERVVVPLVTENGPGLGLVPITIVIDRNQFKGQGRGYQVVCPDALGLWHAKLVLLMCQDGRRRSTILAVGSGNLTTTGWERNQELFRVVVVDRWWVPASIVEWLAAAPLRGTDFDHWYRDHLDEVGVNTTCNGRLLSSFNRPLWEHLRWRRGQRWAEACVVAPFVDGELAERPDVGITFFERLLARAQEGSRLSVYLSGVPGHEQQVYGRRAFFERLLAAHAKTRLYRVSPEGGLLHAKLLCYRTGGIWRCVVGSPNATGPAWTQEHGNIELAWDLGRLGRDLPKGLLPKATAISPESVEFVEPKFVRENRWHAISSAVYDPTRKAIQVDWVEGHGPRDTAVWFGAGRRRRLTFRRSTSSPVADFEQLPDRFLETVPLSSSAYKPEAVPVRVPVSLADCDVGQPTSLTPDDWLRSIGDGDTGLEREDADGTGVVGRARRRGRGTTNAATFEWKERVEFLRRQLSGLSDRIEQVATVREVDLIVRQLDGAWAAHDPGLTSAAANDRAWNQWVRAGLWQTLGVCDGRKTKLHGPLLDRRREWERTIPRLLKENRLVG